MLIRQLFSRHVAMSSHPAKQQHLSLSPADMQARDTYPSALLETPTKLR